ncbi:hypothetical protein SAMN06893096_102242 [Geodermatophilus pulveris]|uniref:Uncharacterized protein n=1 Tax=Geodermatophilus pulveris TaxID=1564159 RepID=A0A239C5R0_9ACTN|nr:hypothetical protein [Geodermatophilus pulveris]SNS15008.1 hypothetical protein SAMN06893096_102242 [Geodermatophilus pulveris]
MFLHTGGSVLPAVVPHATLDLSGVPLPAAGGDWRPALLSVGPQVAVAAVLVAAGGLRRPPPG